MMASLSGALGSANRRHATKTWPVCGSIASVAPWLMASAARLTRIAGLQVVPQSIDRLRKISDRSVAPSPVMEE